MLEFYLAVEELKGLAEKTQKHGLKFEEILDKFLRGRAVESELNNNKKQQEKKNITKSLPSVQKNLLINTIYYCFVLLHLKMCTQNNIENNIT